MDRAEALAQLTSGATRERLSAARALAESGEPEDEGALRAALANESVSWVASALTRAIASVSRKSAKLDRDDSFEVRPRAIGEAAAQIVHEVAPILGALRLFASREVPSFESSRTAGELKRLQDLLSALESLSRSTGPPSFDKFSLPPLIAEVSEGVSEATGVDVRQTGPEEFSVVGDRGFVEMVVRNGLVNAAEAMEGTKGERSIVVSWGDTDIDYWISILDRGIGLPSSLAGIRDLGTTTKLGHLGMGLAIAGHAATGMSGAIELVPAEAGGTRFEFRWPKEELR